jgi:hypothetical protein
MRTLPSWAFWLPCVLAVAAAVLFAAIDLGGMVTGQLGGAESGVRWLKAGAIGQGVLALVAATVLAAGATHPHWRPGTALTGWGLIALETGWFLLTRAH